MALLALGEGMGTPVTIAALRRYTTTAQRSIAYSVFYAIMNGGFFIALYISDALRAGMGEHGRFAVPGLGMELSTYRTILLASLALSVPSFVLTYFWLREGVEATDQGVVITPEQPKYPGLNMFQALGSTVRDTLRETGRIFARPVAAARLLQVHCLPLLRRVHQDDLPAHGLHLPEVRHSRAGRGRSHRASLCAEQHPHRLPRPARRRDDPEAFPPTAWLSSGASSPPPRSLS